MEKYLIVFIFVFSICSGFSQNTDIDSLRDLIIYTGENELYIATKDNKNGIYDLHKNNFILEPQFTFCELSKENEVIIGFNQKKKNLSIIDFSFLSFPGNLSIKNAARKIELYKNFSLKEKSLVETTYVILDEDTSVTSSFTSMSSILELYSDKVTYDTSEMVIFKRAQVFCLEVINDSILIFLDYRNEVIHPSKRFLRSIEFPDEDSVRGVTLSDNNNRVSGIDGFSEYGESGVYDFINKKWLIYPSCKNIIFKNDIFIYEERQFGCFKPKFLQKTKKL